MKPEAQAILELLQGSQVGRIAAERADVRALAGPPVRVDGLDLDLDAQLILRFFELMEGPTLSELEPQAGREMLGELSQLVGGPAAEVRAVRDFVLDASSGLPARLYDPHGASDPAPGLVWFHGGGWVLGDIEAADTTCRLLAARAGVRVVAVDYRLAPEHPFPAAAEDAIAAFGEIAARAAELGLDPDRLAVAGDSAGGNLAAVCSLHAVIEGGPSPALQLLFYPACDLSQPYPSYTLFSEGFFLTEADMDWFKGHYLRSAEDALDWRASPLLAPTVAGAAPAYVATAGFDPLRDEGEAYARRLREAGVPVALRRHDGLLHAFASMIGLGTACREATLEAAGALRLGLAGAS